MPGKIVLSRGNYQNLGSYQNSVVIFDATHDFCSLFLKTGDRTIDQMIQAARSGKQNIVEGCVDAKVSTESEIKLIGVARGSFDELLNDYQDYLRVHNLALWSKDDARIQEIRQFTQTGEKSYAEYKTYFNLEKDTPELFCNLLITLIHQTNFLLDRYLNSLEKSFANTGGIRERMSHTRIEQRNLQWEEALTLLREIYRDLASIKRQDLMEKVEKVAAILKGGRK